jgi:hypothetical protein
MTNNERELSVTVRTEAGEPIYRASVTVTAGWLASAGSSSSGALKDQAESSLL